MSLTKGKGLGTEKISCMNNRFNDQRNSVYPGSTFCIEASLLQVLGETSGPVQPSQWGASPTPDTPEVRSIPTACYRLPCAVGTVVVAK